jgi:hypothetical protein
LILHFNNFDEFIEHHPIEIIVKIKKKNNSEFEKFGSIKLDLKKIKPTKKFS